jgi:hypothetical protein
MIILIFAIALGIQLYVMKITQVLLELAIFVKKIVYIAVKVGVVYIAMIIIIWI